MESACCRIIADDKEAEVLQPEDQPIPVYMIGYDLHPSEAEKYSDLYTALEMIGSGGYWDCLDSTWLVISDKTPAQIRDELKPHLKENDRLLVMRCGEGVSWYGFKDDCLTWLEDNL